MPDGGISAQALAAAADVAIVVWLLAGRARRGSAAR